MGRKAEALDDAADRMARNAMEMKIRSDFCCCVALMKEDLDLLVPKVVKLFQGMRKAGKPVWPTKKEEKERLRRKRIHEVQGLAPLERKPQQLEEEPPEFIFEDGPLALEDKPHPLAIEAGPPMAAIEDGYVDPASEDDDLDGQPVEEDPIDELAQSLDKPIPRNYQTYGDITQKWLTPMLKFMDRGTLSEPNQRTYCKAKSKKIPVEPLQAVMEYTTNVDTTRRLSHKTFLECAVWLKGVAEGLGRLKDLALPANFGSPNGPAVYLLEILKNVIKKHPGQFFKHLTPIVDIIVLRKPGWIHMVPENSYVSTPVFSTEG